MLKIESNVLSGRGVVFACLHCYALNMYFTLNNQVVNWQYATISLGMSEITSPPEQLEEEVEYEVKQALHILEGLAQYYVADLETAAYIESQRAILLVQEAGAKVTYHRDGFGMLRMYVTLAHDMPFAFMAL